MREAYYLQLTQFESIAKRKLRGDQLTEDRRIEISGQDLRDGRRASQLLDFGLGTVGSRQQPVVRGSFPVGYAASGHVL